MTEMTIDEIREKYKHLLNTNKKHEETLSEHILGTLEGVYDLEQILPPFEDQKEKMKTILILTQYMKDILDVIEKNANSQLKQIESEEVKDV